MLITHDNLHRHLSHGKIFLLSGLFFMAFVANGQYVSRLGRFQVDQIKGCAPFTVNITATNLKPGHDCGTSTCQMTFEPAVVEQNTFTYTYTAPGTYTLFVLYPSTIGEAADDITITVLPNIQPEFDIYTCSNNGVTIKITDKNYDQYVVDYGDASTPVTLPAGTSPTAQHTYASSANYAISVHGIKAGAADNCYPTIKNFAALTVLPAPFMSLLTAVDPGSLKIDWNAASNLQLKLEIAVNNSGTFQLYQTLYGTASFTVSGLDLVKNYYCFKLSTHDPCTGADTPGNIICSQKFTVTPESQVDKLAWVTEGIITNFSISRNGTSLTTAAGNSYDDNTVICNTSYCYQVTSNYTNGSQSVSLSTCVTAFSSVIPTPVDYTSSVVGPGGVELTWLQNPAYTASQYLITRRQGTGNFLFQTYAPGLVYDDNAYTTDDAYCYRIKYTDLCGNESPIGQNICPVRLAGILDKTNAVHLSWNKYTGWVDGVKNYSLEKFDADGNLLKTVSLGTDTVYVDPEDDLVHQVVTYKVTAMSLNGAVINSVSNVLRVVKEANLWFPTAFTPDHNGLNETFTVKGFFITRLELRIFNRWGTMIFYTDKDEPWDGKFNGRPMPNDTYAWTASITDLAGQNFSRAGTVMLLTK